MSTGSPKRTRSTLQLPPGRIARMIAQLQRSEVLTRISLCLIAALLMWLFTFGWSPPFAYRTGYIPPRDIVARTQFTTDDDEATNKLREESRRSAICVYQHDVRPLTDLQQELKDRIYQVTRADNYETVDQKIWSEFLTETERNDMDAAEKQFVGLRTALTDDPELEKFETVVGRVFEPFVSHGLLDADEHAKVEGSQLFIQVHLSGDEALPTKVEIKDVRVSDAISTIGQRLGAEFMSAMVDPAHAEQLKHHVLAWINNRTLPATLTLNDTATDRAKDDVVSQVETVTRMYSPTASSREDYVLAAGGRRLTTDDVALLKLEYTALNQNMSYADRLGHFLADMGMYVALFTLCGIYVYFRNPSLLNDSRQFAMILGLVVVSVAACSLLSYDNVRAELVPLLLFGMIVAIAYNQELSLLLSSSVALAVVLSLGQGLVEFVIYVATIAAAVQFLNRIRSRTTVIYVGACAGGVALFTTIGVSTVASQVFGGFVVSVESGLTIWDSSGWVLVTNAAWYGLCAVLGGLLMTALLPFVEKLFDVQTDISLLELGDAAHPLLQELVRRAPGTYNHSINVASIAEAAADAIGANGLLCRVGAYFHDIGKMLKPDYFAENQEKGANRHEALVPAMSTLVIIAHVKDGADLARQHGLPSSIIDFIEQHHGNTLVEYFYDQATKQLEDKPDSGELEESSFRYPGPRPQTKEAGVMMVADACESASRTLVEPTPARIESLVHDLLMKRLLDGQFDECNITLSELSLIEDSIVKSLNAVYHGRVKYPEKSEKQHSA